MIADTLRRRNSDGIPNSRLIIVFTDGSSITEHECSWHDLSEKKTVDYFGIKKTVLVATKPVAALHVTYGTMNEQIDVPHGCQVYQAIRSNVTNGVPQVLGRCVGLVKDGKVIEERFLNGLQNEVFGMKL